MSTAPSAELQSLDPYRGRIESDLRQNILPFWSRYVFDPASQRFHGALSNERVVDPAVERGALLISRILWVYSAAYAQYRAPEYLEMADAAYAELMTCFHDRLHGGFFWSVAADGSLLHERKQIYGQAFALYALSEYYAASGRAAVLDQAVELFRLIEAQAREPVYGGYLEAFDRAWQPIADMRLSAVDLNAPKSQNTHLHIMEAYTNLLRVWPDADLRCALAQLLEVMLDHVVCAKTGHLGLFFSADWCAHSDAISFGHDIEAAWLLTAAAEAVGDSALLGRIHALAVKIADITLAEGVDADGGLFYEGDPRGVTNSDKEWWPQAEAVIGFLNAYQISGEARFLRAALGTWDFIEANLIDAQHGEWFRGVSKDRRLLADTLKVSFWKCPYHNGRMGMEAARRLGEIAELAQVSGPKHTR